VPRARRALGWLSLLALVACRDAHGPPVQLVLGPKPSDEVTLLPQASLAEYIEISADESALLLTLSSEPRTCEAGGGGSGNKDVVALAIRVMLPAGSKLAVGSYPLMGDTQTSDRPHARSTVKLRGHRSELRTGGELVLQKVDLSPQGSLEGLLKFEFTGGAEHPATRVSGRFLAHFCRINRLR
jgi:hypothetical protein